MPKADTTEQDTASESIAFLRVGEVARKLYGQSSSATRAKIRTLIGNGTLAAIPVGDYPNGRWWFLVPRGEVDKLPQRAEERRRAIAEANARLAAARRRA